MPTSVSFRFSKFDKFHTFLIFLWGAPFPLTPLLKQSISDCFQSNCCPEKIFVTKSHGLTGESTVYQLKVPKPLYFVHMPFALTKSLHWVSGANVAVTGAGLTPVLEQEGPFTVFLPTTEAFAAIDNATVSSFIQNITLLQRKS